MRPYGHVQVHGNGFAITAEPHVMIRLKNLFPRISKSEFGSVRLSITPETCRDLEWFALRFPLAADAAADRAIKEGAYAHRATEQRVRTIIADDYTPTDYPLAKPLREYQRQAIDLYLAHGGLLVGDQVGLGKTVTAIGSLIDNRTLPVLIVCQVHLCRQWLDFLAEFLPAARAHIVKKASPYSLPTVDAYIISYSKLSGWGDVFSQGGALRSIVFDEVQELRHASTDKYLAASAIRKALPFALGLSATPIYNYGGEIFSIINLLSPDRLGGRFEFNREWCHGVGDKQVLTDPKAFGQYLRDEGLMIRRTRQDVGLELPALERVVQTVPYDPRVIDEIQDMALELARLVLSGTFLERGQAARELDLQLRQATGIAKAAFVAAFVRLLVEDGQRVLLFGWHRAVYDVWLAKLSDFNPVLYTGTESAVQKRGAQTAFQTGDAKVLIMSLRSGSGVDGLQLASNVVVFGELDWSPGVHEQCIGRLNRDGVAGGVTAYYLVSDAGSDPLVAEILQLKKAQSAHMLDPKQEGDLGQMQSTGDHIKNLARQFLSAHSQLRE